MASKPVTAAAENLGIKVSVSHLSDDVKKAICLFSDIVDAIDNHSGVRGSKKPISAENLGGLLVLHQVMEKRGMSNSIYATIGDHTIRLSDHSAVADNFKTSGENLSISLLPMGKTNDFVRNNSAKVIEAKFRKKYLNEHPQVFRKMIEDIARFAVTGEYHDTAGALDYNLSGGEEFELSALLRFYDDAVARNDESKAQI